MVLVLYIVLYRLPETVRIYARSHKFKQEKILPRRKEVDTMSYP